MGEKPILGIPRVYVGNIELGKVNIKDGLVFKHRLTLKVVLMLIGASLAI